MQNLVFTQLSITEVRQLFQEELAAFFATHALDKGTAPPDEIGGVELAEVITGLARPTIYSLASQRKIPHSKQGKKLYFSRFELTEWIKAGRRKTTADLQAEAESYTAQTVMRVAPRRNGKARPGTTGLAKK